LDADSLPFVGLDIVGVARDDSGVIGFVVVFENEQVSKGIDLGDEELKEKMFER
jgi:hypothetical protein